MSTRGPKLDDLSASVLAWAKAHAVASQEGSLDLPHLMLGALKADAGRHLLGELLASDYPLDPSPFAPDLRERLARVSQPITDQQLPLSPRLKAMVSDLIAGQRELCAKPLLERQPLGWAESRVRAGLGIPFGLGGEGSRPGASRRGGVRSALCQPAGAPARRG